LKVIASYSTAYITPSLYQLYGPYGNLNLIPEENATAEFGFESQLLDKKLTINAVGFYRTEENTIGFFYDAATFESYYVTNIGRNNAKGLETTIRYHFSKQISFIGNYTFTQVDKILNRLIPKNKANLEVNYKFKRGNLAGQYQFVDQRIDTYYDANVWATQTTNLSAYQLLNTTFSYELLPKRLHVFTAITNVMNESFQEVLGYNTRGRNYKLGVTFLF
jgi:vitamin B12 transporter